MSRNWLAAGLGLCWFALLCGIALAQNTSPNSSPASTREETTRQEPLIYREVFVPSDQIAQLVRGYFAIKRQEFRERIAAINAAANGGERFTRIVSATYSARFENDQLVGGRSELQIEHESSTDVFLPLTGLQLALEDAIWQRPTGLSQRASLGLNASGRPVLRVRQSGTLNLHWSLRGSSGPQGEVVFGLGLPASPSNRLILDLPSTMVPKVDGAVVVRDESAGTEAAGEAEPEQASSAPVVQRWRIELGGQQQISLRVVPSAAVQETQQLVMLRQENTYRFSRQAVNVFADLRLDVHNQPLHELRLLADPHLRIAHAQVGDKLLRPTSTQSTESGPVEVVFALPEPLQGSDREVRIRAVAPLTTDQPWSLPILQVAEVIWQEGTTTLEIPHGLHLQQLVTRHCRQTKSVPAPEPEGGQLLELQHYAPDASAELIVSPRRAELAVTSGTTLKVTQSVLTATMKVDLTSRWGPAYQLEAEVPEEWTIEDVTSEPADALYDYQLLPSATEHSRLLVLQLRRPVLPGSRVRFSLLARRRWAPEEDTLTWEHFRVLRFQQLTEERHLVSVQPHASQQMEVAGDLQLQRITPSDLMPRELELIEARGEGLLFLDDYRADGIAIRLTHQKPFYTADIELDATVEDEQLAELYRIRCMPQGSQVDRVLVHFSEYRDAPITWSVEGSSDEIATARLWSPSEQRDVGLSGGETWQLDLRRPRSKPFEIQAERVAEMRGEMLLALASVPESAAQSGRVIVRSAGGESFRLQTRDVQVLPYNAESEASYTSVRAALRYEPLQDAAISLAPTQPGEQQSPAWAWGLELVSRFASDGRGHHVATYRLENSGLPQLRITLSPAVRLEEVRVDGRRVPTIAAGPQGTIEIALPEDLRYPRLEVEYTTAGRALGWLDRLQAPVPELNIPVLQRRWAVWLPAGYEERQLVYEPLEKSAREPDWLHRLLGPLRADASSPWLAPQAWADSAPEGDVDQARQAARQVLSQLAGQIRSNRTSELTWGDLFRSAEVAEAAAAVPLQIDAIALQAAAIGPDSALPKPGPGSAASATSESYLEQAGLVLLVHPRTLLLTTATRRAMHADQLVPDSSPVVYLVKSGPLAEELTSPWDLGRTFASPAQWTATPYPPKSPWWDGQRATPSTAQVGWTIRAVRLPRNANGQLALAIYYAPRLQLLAWTVFLIATALTAWLVARSRVLLPLLVMAAATAALLLPWPVAQLGTATFLGTLMGALVWLVWQAPWSPRIRSGSSILRTPRSTIRQVGSAAGVLLLGLAMAASAQESTSTASAPASSAKRPVIYPVVVPVDAQQQPTGDYVYLPKEFYEALQLRVASVNAEPRGWLLESSQYRAVLERASSGARLELREVGAEYIVRANDASARIEFPCTSDQVLVESVEAYVGGQVVAVTRTETARGVAVQLDRPGEHRLVFTLRPTVRANGRRAGFEFSIPSVPKSELRVQLPADAGGLELPVAFGATVSSTLAGEQRVQLGPAEQLALSWPTDPELMIMPSELEVEQLVWLQVLPANVLLEGRFRFTAAEGTVEQVQLLADPRLRLLLPVEADPPLSGEPLVEEGETWNTIRLPLDPSAGRSFELRLRFHLSGTSGVGNLRFPRVEAVADRVTRDWLGVSVAPSLEHEPLEIAALQQVRPDEFSQHWRDATSLPELAVDLSGSDAPWHLAVRPKQSHLLVDQQIDLYIGQRSAEVEYIARLDSTDGRRLRYEIEAPPELKVERVAVVEQGVQRPVRFGQASSGLVTAFLDTPATGPLELRLRGKLNIDADGRLGLPELELREASVANRQWRIYRRPDALVEVAGQLENLRELAPEEIGQWEGDSGRVVATLGPEEVAAPVKGSLHVRVNRPQGMAEATTRLERQEETWNADVHYRLTVEEGLFDAVRLEIPAWWNGPFTVEPAMPLQVVDVPGKAIRHLVLRPQQPIGDELHVHVRAKLEGLPLRAPEVRPLDVSRASRYLVVPTQLGLRHLAWDTAGLQLTSPRRDVCGAMPATKSQAWYQVIGQRMQATIREVKSAFGDAQVRLADIHLLWHRDGSCDGVALFDLEPAGRSECVLRMPPALELVHVRVEGLPARLERVDSHRWKLQLGARQLPQRVVVVYAGKLPDPALAKGAGKLEAPTLVGLPVTRTLWTVHGPQAAGPGRVASPLQATTEVQQDVERLVSTASLIQGASDVVAESVQEDVAEAFRPWLRRLVLLNDRLERYEAAGPRMRVSVPGDVLSVEQLAQRLGVTDVANVMQVARKTPSDAAGVWQVLANSTRTPPVRLAEDGAVKVLHLEYPELAPSQAATPIVPLVVVLGGVLATTWLARKGMLADWLSEWPYLAGVLSGLAWWLWLTPGLFGLVIILVSLFGALRPGWRYQTLGRSSSQVVRTTVSGSRS